jgi:hypothetical protein
VLFAFYSALYLIGLLCILPLSRKVPLWLLSATGFLWGILAWVAVTMIVLLLGLTYNWMHMLLLLLPFVFAAIGANAYYGTFPRSGVQWGVIFTGLVSFAAVAFLVTQQYYVVATPDSFYMIYHGRTLAEAGLTPWANDQFSEWGLIIPVILMSSHLLPVDYLSGYQTLIGGSLIATFVVGIFQFTRRHFAPTLAIIQTSMFTLIFMSILFISHVFYIHSNLPATAYLVVALYAYWYFLRNEAVEWLILGSLAITAFGFTRIEGVLYVLVFLLLVMSLKRHDYKWLLAIILPYTTVSILWYLYLYAVVNESGLLSQTNILVILLALLSCVFLGIASRLSWVSSLLTYMPYIIIGGLCVGLVLSFALKPEHMLTSTTNVLRNLADINSWGWSWIVIAALLPIFLDRDEQQPENRLLIYGVACYILLVILLGFARNPYRLSAYDSANRLLLHVQPIFFLYFAIKSNKLRAWFLTERQNQ